MFGDQTYDPNCIKELFLPFDLIHQEPVSAEQVLDFVARERGIDRRNESSFSAYHFPKVVDESELLDGERCGLCFRPFRR
ncbi:hypothetical protein ABZ896_17240 [Streptomyces sp. NPDC047072]|uniref:hypothetical protein n=1 Tax=Streptomyces sp. NPDC047072 TaxID=3154809 RepID=UPI0033D86A4D